MSRSDGKAPDAKEPIKPAQDTALKETAAVEQTAPEPTTPPRPVEEGKLVYLKLSEVHPFHTFRPHPFKVRDDAKMQEIVASIRVNGVMVPGLARPEKDGNGYEIVAGHRRTHGSELAGLEEMPFIVREMTDHEAVQAMKDSNKHYNPLAYIRNEADILKFVDALISNTKGEGKEGDPFWTKSETLLYCALIAYIIFEGPAEDRNMNTLVDMISGMEVKEDDENYKNAVDYMFDGLAKRKPDCFAVKQYRKFKLSSGKTAKSILISCGARLAPFDIPQLREIMSYDELELDRMGDRRTATFFCISDTDSTYNFLVALAFSQMFNLLCERADNVHGGRLPHHVRVLWDEAANTGQVPQLEKLVAVIRSREISLCLLYQQLAQCKAIYDKNAETILGNMDSVLFLGGRESSTIKEISENWLGKATISMQTEGRSRGQSESYSQNTQRLGRELMTPSELATMPGDRCILQLRGLPPFYSKKYDLKQHPNYKYTAEADKVKNAFDLNSLVTRRMDKLNPNETYTVYKVDVPDEALTGEDEDILNYDDLDDPDAFV